MNSFLFRKSIHFVLRTTLPMISFINLWQRNKKLFTLKIKMYNLFLQKLLSFIQLTVCVSLIKTTAQCYIAINRNRQLLFHLKQGTNKKLRENNYLGDKGVKPFWIKVLLNIIYNSITNNIFDIKFIIQSDFYFTLSFPPCLMKNRSINTVEIKKIKQMMVTDHEA